MRRVSPRMVRRFSPCTAQPTPINAPDNTLAYYRLAARPKFLVLLIGASHRPPYTSQEPQLRIVERATIAFLDHYLKHAPLRSLVLAARNPGLSTIEADP